MANYTYKIKELKGINGYQLLQVVYFLLRSAYYTPEINHEYTNISDFFKHVASLSESELDDFCKMLSVLGADLSKEYWDIIFTNLETDGHNIIPESIQTLPVEDLVYIIKESIKKVLRINIPF